MHKYHSYKQYLYSHRKANQIKSFLERETSLNLLQVVDDERRTPIHHCALYNHHQVMEMYLQYASEHLVSSREQKMKEWLNQHNRSGLAAIHYAAYHGNTIIIDLLKKYGANIHSLTNKKMNSLHMAAQKDTLQTFIYFEDEIDINSLDENDSTPLHWASYVGSKRVVQYLLAKPQTNINAINRQGNSPLHLATIYKNQQIVKKLLLRGVDRSLPNLQHKTPLKIARENQFTAIERMLNNNYTCRQKCQIFCHKRMKYEAHQTTIAQPFIFILWLLFMITINNVLFSYILQFASYLQYGFVGFILALYVSLLVSKPRSERKLPHYNQQDLNKICFQCKAIKPDRSIHCCVCGRCVQMYDHHCVWIANCVGKHNILRYYLFVLCLFLYLLYLVGYGVLILVGQFEMEQILKIRFHDLPPQIYYIPGVIDVVMGLILGFMVMILLLRQTKNLCTNTTNHERNTREKQGSFIKGKKQEQSVFSLRNCVSMCQEEKKFNSLTTKTTDSLLD